MNTIMTLPRTHTPTRARLTLAAARREHHSARLNGCHVSSGAAVTRENKRPSGARKRRRFF